MFIRITRSGGRRYVQIAHSFRDPETGKPRQRYIANLGRVEQLGTAELDSLINGLLKITGRPIMAERDSEITSDNTIFERALELGDIWAVMGIWRQLSLVQAISRQAAKRRFQVDMEKLIRTMVINRLSDPRSKLGLLEWLSSVALPGIDKAEITHTNLLRAMDFLLEQKEVLEKQLASSLLPLFGNDLEVVFYDITTIAIHGEGQEDGDVRAFGRAKHADLVQRQFAVGLVQTADGLPLTHEVFEGNVGESTTVEGMVKRLRERFPIRRLVFVADRGMISKANLEYLESIEVSPGVKAEYIVAVPARRYTTMTKDLATIRQELKEESRRTKREAVRELEVDGRRLVVAYCPEIARRARRQRAKRLAEAWRLAGDMAFRLNEQEEGKRGKGRPLSDRGARLRFRDHLRERRLTRLLEVDWSEESFGWSWNVPELKRELLLDGLLVLVSNATQLTASQLVTQYKELADIERGFRVMKNEIAVAPVHHRLPDRIRAHAMICFLALVIHRTLRFHLRKAASELSPATLLYRLKAIQQHQVRLATGQVLTGVTAMRPEQQKLFEMIEVDPPKRADLTA